ncbi:hypothetical protein PVAND_003214 [Polypedilum vanderplanki]|uniref:Odorant receptor n=1 Tax=Polypedilum vanderplanki TaxID=319348 RepID=A0A9J6BTD1_POLVA|nr:hypothetical protein PVAND_003214 [Polypedilum vanderplanki]
MDLTPFNLPKKILKILGMWQEKNSPFWYKIYGLFLHLYILEHSCFCQTIYAVITVQEKNYKDFIDTFSILLTCYLTIFKTLIFIKNLQKIKKLTKKLESLLKFSNFNSEPRPNVKFYSTRIRKITNSTYGFHTAIITLSFLMPLIGHNRKLPFKTWAYFDYEKTELSFMTIMIMEFTTSAFTVAINSSLDVYPVIFMCYTIAMLKELSEHFKKVKNSCEKIKENGNSEYKSKSFGNSIKNLENSSIKLKNVNNLLKYQKIQNSKTEPKEIDLKICVDLHRKLKDFCYEISSNYALHFMVQIFFSTLLLCSSVFHLTKLSFDVETSLFFRTLMYVIIMVIQVFLPCHYGNEITVASDELSLSVFHSDWIKSGQNYKGKIKFVLTNLKKRINIEVFGIFHVNYEIFNSVCNSAYSIYALLKKNM